MSAYRDATGPPLGGCPRCKEPQLAAVVSGATTAFACKSCGGVFARRDTLQRFASGATADLRALADEATRAPPGQQPQTSDDLECPWCLTPMQRIEVPSARCAIDVCPAHGAWFDRWEVQLVAKVVRNPAAAAALRLSLR